MRKTASTKTAALDRDAAKLSQVLSDLIRAYQFRDRKRMCVYDISVTECYALNCLVRLGPMRLEALASELYLDKSTTSRAVDSLEEKGYLRRGDDPDDARALRLETTRKGANLHTRIERDLIEEQKQLLAGVNPEVRRAAVELVGKLAVAAQTKFHSSRRARPGCAA